MREMHDIVTFTKDGQKITGKIADFYYDKHKNTMVAVNDRLDSSKIFFVLESELD